MKKTEKSKPTKKKILMYYLILAASLLAVAGITVGIIFGVRGNSVTPPGTTIDGDNKPDNKDPDDGKNPDDDKKPDDSTNTSTTLELIVPVKDVNLTQAHVFAFDKTCKYYRLHEGMDFACSAGTDIFAAEDGKVKSVVTNDYLSGAVITIEHANNVTTVYKFIDPVTTLKAGDSVQKGAVIGKVAKATGNEIEEGDHLHFEVYENNIMQDPDKYLNIISK